MIPCRFPCSTGKNSKKRLFRPFTGRKFTLEAIDSIRFLAKFRYAAKQRNFAGRSGELFGPTAELQRNLFVVFGP
jgi:hypothetical protein